MFDCDNCGKKILAEEPEQAKNETVCSNCFESYYFKCPSCEEWMHEEDLTGEVCEDCIYDAEVYETQQSDMH